MPDRVRRRGPRALPEAGEAELLARAIRGLWPDVTLAVAARALGVKAGYLGQLMGGHRRASGRFWGMLTGQSLGASDRLRRHREARVAALLAEYEGYLAVASRVGDELRARDDARRLARRELPPRRRR